MHGDLIWDFGAGGWGRCMGSVSNVLVYLIQGTDTSIITGSDQELTMLAHLDFLNGPLKLF